jgi:hypothetical protein
VSAKELWGDERRRLQSEVARVETHFERMRSERDVKEHELSALGARERTAGDSHRRGFEKLTAERDALKQQLAQSAQRRLQSENESRKREKESERLKEKLSALVNDKRRDVVCGSIQIGKPTAAGGVKEDGVRQGLTLVHFSA